MNCVDRGDLVGTMFIGCRKAFDMVDLSHFIRKLSSYKLSASSLNWYRSYLDARLQAISSDHGLSEVFKTLLAVPQGSLLGPALISLFINDPLNIVQRISLQMSALSMYQAKPRAMLSLGSSLMAPILMNGANVIKCV